MADYSAEVKKQVLEMYKSGVIIRDITERTGVPKATIYDWVGKAKITPDRLQRPMHAGVVDVPTLMEELERLRDELAVARNDLERERQIVRWFLERTLIDPAALARELEASVRKPARPRKA